MLRDIVSYDSQCVTELINSTIVQTQSTAIIAMLQTLIKCYIIQRGTLIPLHFHIMSTP